MAGNDFDFSKLESSDESPSRTTGGSRRGKSKKRHRKNNKKGMPLGVIITVGVVLVGIGVCVATLMLREDPEPVANASQEPRAIDKSYTVDELSSLQVDIKQLVQSAASTRYTLVDAPAGAGVSATGQLNWRPSEQQGPRQYNFVVEAYEGDLDAPAARVRLSVLVREVNQAPKIDPVLPQLVDGLDGLQLQISASDPDSPPVPLKYELIDGAPDGVTLDQQTGKFTWTPGPDATDKPYLVKVQVSESAPAGLSSTVQIPIRLAKAKVAVDVNLGGFEMPKMTEPEQPEVTSPASESTTRQPTGEQADEAILTLYRDRELFKPTQYSVLRKIYATRFEQEHEDDIRVALAADYEEAKAWFDEHVGIKEELYTAIDPEFDDVGAAVVMFNTLRKEYPEQVVSHAPLAIATAVVWDNGKGVYRYQGHQRRTKSVMPEALLDGLQNFQYFLSAEQIMQGRGRFLPWEFLVHVINHPTPADERQWAVVNYLPKRVMFGKCYHDVPYDSVMLQSGSEITRLDGKPYTLPNLRQYGGVCSMQADFASRVGKSLGVPAAYVTGKGRFGGSHAWVMWIEIQSVTAAGIQFLLKSHGRYRGDHYYVGNLKDPQTGKGMTDRQLELQLQAVGIGPMEKRRADWLMDSFSLVAETENLDVLDRMRYLEQVLRVCPLNEDAWRVLADMSRDGLIQREHATLMMANMNGLFTSFAHFPDFTWDVFDDLIAFQKSPKIRDGLYGQLVRMYEAAGRPDLACQARLKYTDYLEEQNLLGAAMSGLAFTIQKFPQEGRYVPLMLDRLEQIAGQVDGGDQQLLAFYKLLLPKIQRKRGDAPSKYCMEMYRRGIERFDQAGDVRTAGLLKAELAKLEAGNVKF